MQHVLNIILRLGYTSSYVSPFNFINLHCITAKVVSLKIRLFFSYLQFKIVSILRYFMMRFDRRFSVFDKLLLFETIMFLELLEF